MTLAESRFSKETIRWLFCHKPANKGGREDEIPSAEDSTSSCSPPPCGYSCPYNSTGWHHRKEQKKLVRKNTATLPKDNFIQSVSAIFWPSNRFLSILNTIQIMWQFSPCRFPQFCDASSPVYQTIPYPQQSFQAKEQSDRFAHRFEIQPCHKSLSRFRCG